MLGNDCSLALHSAKMGLKPGTSSLPAPGPCPHLHGTSGGTYKPLDSSPFYLLSQPHQIALPDYLSPAQIPVCTGSEVGVCLKGKGPKGSLRNRPSSSSPLPTGPKDLHLKAHCVCPNRAGEQAAEQCCLSSYSSQSPGSSGGDAPMDPGRSQRGLCLKSCGWGEGRGCRGGPNNKSHHRPQVLPGSIFLSACFELSSQQLRHLLDPGNLGLPWGLGRTGLADGLLSFKEREIPHPFHACGMESGTDSLRHHRLLQFLGPCPTFPVSDVPAGIPYKATREERIKERTGGCFQAEGCLCTTVWNMDSTPHT